MEIDGEKVVKMNQAIFECIVSLLATRERAPRISISNRNNSGWFRSQPNPTTYREAGCSSHVQRKQSVKRCETKIDQER